jgi:hypothetical protein
MFKIRLFKSEPEEMKINEVGMILLGKFEREKRDLENKLADTVKDLNIQFKEIEALIVLLREKTTPETYANTVKNKFCAKSIEALADLSDYSETYDSLKKFVSKSNETVRIIGGLDMKEFRHLHAFSDDMAHIAEKIRLLESGLNFANKIISDSVMLKIDKIKDMISKMDDLGAGVKIADDESVETREFIESLKGMIKIGEENIDALNRKFSEYTGDKIRLRDIDRSSDLIRQKIEAEFSGLDRVFKKFLYFGDLSKMDSLLLNNYIRSPGQAFLEDRENTIKGILDSLYRFKNRDIIDMDDGKFSHVEGLLKRFQTLLDLRDQYDETNRKKSDLEKEFSDQLEPVAKEMKASLADLEHRRKELATLEAKLRSYDTEKRVAVQEIEDTRNNLELSLSKLLNRDVKLI